MVDMPLSGSSPTTFGALKVAQLLLAIFLITSGCWVAVNEALAKDRCQTPLGRLALRFKLDSYYSGCRCMTHSLDFSDACNSMYLPLM
jgi:hypothetical protein